MIQAYIEEFDEILKYVKNKHFCAKFYAIVYDARQFGHQSEVSFATKYYLVK